MKNRIHIIAVVVSILVFASCTNKEIKLQFELIESGKIIPKGIKVTYPQNGTIFPPEFPSPHFEWVDTIVQSREYNLFVSNKQGKILIYSKSKNNIWRPDSVEWEKIKNYVNTGDYSFTVIGNSIDGKIYPSAKINFTFSKDSVGADIFFRAVTLPFSYAVKNVHTIEWYMGSVKGGSPRKMLDNLPVCGNCHSFSKEKPLLAMDVDYGNDKGSYVIAEASDTCFLKPENIITWSDYKREENEPTFGLLSQISPDGNYVLSTIKDLSVFVAIDNNLAYSQLFFPIKGIIGIYDCKNKTFDALNGANDSKYVQSNPSWSPDGKNIVFARTEAYVSERVKKAGRALLHIDDVKEFSSGEKQFKYDLYAVGFNNAKGGKAEPLQGASNNSKSNYFPKYSPDGKWIVFCQAENFMLLRSDSRLYIMPSTGGQARKMNCNMDEMNSWHSWSPNSRWLVFSSKQGGLYTQLYLTHIDENGMDSPPILLENLRFEKRAANIPEFFPGNAENFNKIKDVFSNTAPYFTSIAADNIENKYFKRAWDNISKAIATDSTYLEAYLQRIMLNALLKQSNSKTDRADKLKVKVIADGLLLKQPENEQRLLLQATLLSNSGKTDKALELANQIIKKNPQNYKTYELISSIYRKTKQYEKILPIYTKMLSLFPSTSSRNQIKSFTASLYNDMGQFENALLILNQLFNSNPQDLNIIASRAEIYIKTDNLTKAKHDIDILIEKDSLNYKYHQLKAQYFLKMKRKDDYLNELSLSLALIDKQILSNNENINVLFGKATILTSLKKWDEAESVYNNILKIFPVNYEALKEKARIKISQQLWNDAIYLYNQLDENYLPEEEFYNNRAIAYINLGNNDQALFQFNKVIELNPDNFDARYNRARLYHLTGNDKLANEELQKIKSDMLRKQKQGKLNDSEAGLLKSL